MEPASKKARKEPNMIALAINQGIGPAENQAVSEFKKARAQSTGCDTHKGPTSHKARSAGNISGKERYKREGVAIVQKLSRTQSEKEKRSRPCSKDRQPTPVRPSQPVTLSRPSSWCGSSLAVTRNNEKYDRTVNVDRCDQTLLKHCQRAIELRRQETGKPTTGKEEFLWRCLAQPAEVRSQLKATDLNNIGMCDPVSFLIKTAGTLKDRWWSKEERKKHKNEKRWQCTSCGGRPFVSWDVCFRCGSYAESP